MAVSLASSWHEVEPAIRGAQRIWIGLDFDGTLAPIADRPDQVQLSRQTREALRSLSTRHDVSVAIVSGRELCDVRQIVAIESLAYSGNHGLEIEGPKLSYASPLAAAMCDDVARMADALSVRLAHLDQLLVENKRLSLSVHYRLVPAQAWPEVLSAVETVVQDYESFRVLPGAMVWEIRPRVSANKGTAALWLRKHQSGEKGLPIFIGDDVTDEDAFRAFPDGITIKVGGQRPTIARYAVAGPEEVLSFLTRLPSLK